MYHALAIAIGGAAGALVRYGLGILIAGRWNQGFPWHTFTINVSGAFLLGFLNILFIERLNLDPVWRLGIGVGFLGAYTTFSTFSYETLSLIESGNYLTAGLYVLCSVILSLLFVTVGAGLARLL